MGGGWSFSLYGLASMFYKLLKNLVNRFNDEIKIKIKGLSEKRETLLRD